MLLGKDPVTTNLRLVYEKVELLDLTNSLLVPTTRPYENDTGSLGEFGNCSRLV